MSLVLLVPGMRMGGSDSGAPTAKPRRMLMGLGLSWLMPFLLMLRDFYGR